MNAIVISVLVVMANVLGAGMIVPQVVRLHRSRIVDGLSGAWVGVGFGMNLWWTAYAIQTPLYGMLPVSLAGAALYSTIAVQLIRLSGPQVLKSLAVGAFGLAMTPLPALILGGWSAAGLLIGLSYAAQFTPAAIVALRSRDVDGVSPSTWSMAWVEAAIWLIYGLQIDNRALIVGGGGGLIMSSVILARLVYVSSVRSPRQPRLATWGRA